MEGVRVFPRPGPPYSMLWNVLKVPKLERGCPLMWMLTRPGHSVSEVNVCSPYPLCCCWVLVHLYVVYICMCSISVFVPISYSSHTPRDDPFPYPLCPICTVHYMQSLSPHMKYTSAMSLCGLMGWPTSPPLLIL